MEDVNDSTAVETPAEQESAEQQPELTAEGASQFLDDASKYKAALDSGLLPVLDNLSPAEWLKREEARQRAGVDWDLNQGAIDAYREQPQERDAVRTFHHEVEQLPAEIRDKIRGAGIDPARGEFLTSELAGLANGKDVL